MEQLTCANDGVGFSQNTERVIGDVGGTLVRQFERHHANAACFEGGRGFAHHPGRVAGIHSQVVDDHAEAFGGRQKALDEGLQMAHTRIAYQSWVEFGGINRDHRQAFAPQNARPTAGRSAHIQRLSPGWPGEIEHILRFEQFEFGAADLALFAGEALCATRPRRTIERHRRHAQIGPFARQRHRNDGFRLGYIQRNAGSFLHRRCQAFVNLEAREMGVGFIQQAGLNRKRAGRRKMFAQAKRHPLQPIQISRCAIQHQFAVNRRDMAHKHRRTGSQRNRPIVQKLFQFDQHHTRRQFVGGDVVRAVFDFVQRRRNRFGRSRDDKAIGI